MAITTTGLWKSFGIGPSQVVALRDMNFNLHHGCLTVVRGPSGSGKSSLLAALSGLQQPDAGKIVAFGHDIWRNGTNGVRDFRRRHCGFVFQSHGMFSGLSAKSQIASPLTLLGVSRREANTRAEASLALLGLSDRADALPTELSGGQNQRVAIARMLAKRAELLFCDEPTSALDSGNGRLVGELLRTAAREHNAMVLCVTHDERLLPFADRVMVIEDGQIVSDSEARND